MPSWRSIAEGEQIQCSACSHLVRMSVEFLRSRNIEPYQPVLSLKRRLRCRRCHAIGHVDIVIEWRGP
jgi:hypothetical protein